MSSMIRLYILGLTPLHEAFEERRDVLIVVRLHSLSTSHKPNKTTNRSPCQSYNHRGLRMRQASRTHNNSTCAFVADGEVTIEVSIAPLCLSMLKGLFTLFKRRHGTQIASVSVRIFPWSITHEQHMMT